MSRIARLLRTAVWGGGMLSLTFLLIPAPAKAAFSLVMTNGYGDCYRMNLLRDRSNYQAYRGVCNYRGFSLSGCSTTGEVVMLRIAATATMPEHFSILSTSLRWGTTTYVLNDMFRWLSSTTMAGYENWYPFDMSCSVAMYVNSGGFGSAGLPGSLAFPLPTNPDPWAAEQRELLELLSSAPQTPTAFSLVMTNGYGDCYRMNLLRDRSNYQAYRGVCSYRGFSLSGCSTTGEVVMLRIMATPTVPEHFSLVSTSLRWGTTMYFLNDVFRWLNSTTMAGYENWYPFDMSCTVAMYINSGGFGAAGTESAGRAPALRLARNPHAAPDGTNVIGVLIPLSGDLANSGPAYQAAYLHALAEITNTPGMPPIRLVVKDSATDPLWAIEQLAQLYTQGVQVVLGPESSAECEGLLEYANTHGMLLLSSASTAIPLATPGDNLMRFTTDDSRQACQLAGHIMGDGISNLALMVRSDMYGDGLQNAFLQEYGLLGGHVFITGYCPRASGLFPEVTTQLNQAVTAQIARAGADGVGVLAALFDEGELFLMDAASLPGLASVRWYGTDGMAGNTSLLTNAGARAMAHRTQYVCSQPDVFTNAKFAAVSDAIRAQTGEAPITFAVQAYDMLWLAALALRDTGATGTVEEVKAAIRTNAASYTGATGPILFNAADDRASGQYEFLKVASSNAWTDIGNSVPDVPRALAPALVTSNQFTAQWFSSAGATNYRLDVSTQANFSDFLPGYEDRSAGASRSWTLAGLSPGTTYYYRVRAANAAGISPHSEPVPVTLWAAINATNGVPLWWLGQYYTISNNADELALSDTDGDGLQAWEECVAGTLPISAGSCLAAREVAAPAGGRWVVTWEGMLDRLYTIQTAEGLVGAPWTAEPLYTRVPGTGGDLCYTSSLPSTANGGCLRLKVELDE